MLRVSAFHARYRPRAVPLLFSASTSSPPPPTDTLDGAVSLGHFFPPFHDRRVTLLPPFLRTYYRHCRGFSAASHLLCVRPQERTAFATRVHTAASCRVRSSGLSVSTGDGRSAAMMIFAPERTPRGTELENSRIWTYNRVLRCLSKLIDRSAVTRKRVRYPYGGGRVFYMAVFKEGIFRIQTPHSPFEVPLHFFFFCTSIAGTYVIPYKTMLQIPKKNVYIILL